MNNVYVGLTLQTLPAAGAFVYTDPVDTTYMITLTTFIDFTQAAPATGFVMVMESSTDGGATWKKITALGAVSGTGPIDVAIGDGRFVFPTKSDSYATPFNMLGHFLVRFGFAMANPADPSGDLAFSYGAGFRSPP